MSKKSERYFVIVGEWFWFVPRWVAMAAERVGMAAGVFLFLTPEDFSDQQSANHWTEDDWEAFEAAVAAELDEEDKK